MPPQPSAATPHVPPHISPVRADLAPDPLKLRRAEVIAQYHTLRKQLAHVHQSPHLPTPVARAARAAALRAQLNVIGLATYQHASRQGEALAAGFDASKWVLAELASRAAALCGPAPVLHLLDVGAIAHRFPPHVDVPCVPSQSGSEATATAQRPASRVPLQVTSIDLHPEDSEAGRRVVQADFFDFAPHALLDPAAVPYHAVCLSLCLNFEGCPRRRGLMLHLAARLLRDGALLFVVLPRACVANSRYCDEPRFARILAALGMHTISTRTTAKLFLCVARRDSPPLWSAWPALASRHIVRPGKHRNNFAVRLDCILAPDNPTARTRKPAAAAAATTASTVRVHKSASTGTARTTRAARIARPTSEHGVRKVHTTSNGRKKARRKAMRDARAQQRPDRVPYSLRRNA